MHAGGRGSNRGQWLTVGAPGLQRQDLAGWWPVHILSGWLLAAAAGGCGMRASTVQLGQRGVHMHNLLHAGMFAGGQGSGWGAGDLALIFAVLQKPSVAQQRCQQTPAGMICAALRFECKGPPW